MKKLDKHLNEKSTLDFEVDGKVYTAKVNALVMLEIVELGEKATLKEVLTRTFEASFGKENSDELFSKLSIAGINEIAMDINKALGIDIDQTENNPR